MNSTYHLRLNHLQNPNLHAAEIACKPENIPLTLMLADHKPNFPINTQAPRVLGSLAATAEIMSSQL